jgi:serine/threonine protein kinase
MYRLKAQLAGGAASGGPDAAAAATAAAAAAIAGSTSSGGPPPPPPQQPSAPREPPVYTDLREVLGVHSGGPSGRRRGERSGHTPGHYALLLDLVERMLEYDPDRRIKPMAALNHPFLLESIEGGGGAGAEGGGAS